MLRDEIVERNTFPWIKTLTRQKIIGLELEEQICRLAVELSVA